jgi:di- and tripeptidase
LQVYCLDTYKRIAAIDGHRGSVLALCLSDDETLLFSSAGDRFVNVSSLKIDIYTVTNSTRSGIPKVS